MLKLQTLKQGEIKFFNTPEQAQKHIETVIGVKYLKSSACGVIGLLLHYTDGWKVQPIPTGLDTPGLDKKYCVDRCWYLKPDGTEIYLHDGLEVPIGVDAQTDREQFDTLETVAKSKGLVLFRYVYPPLKGQKGYVLQNEREFTSNFYTDLNEIEQLLN